RNQTIRHFDVRIALKNLFLVDAVDRELEVLQDGALRHVAWISVFVWCGYSRVTVGALRAYGDPVDLFREGRCRSGRAAERLPTFQQDRTGRRRAGLSANRARGDFRIGGRRIVQLTGDGDDGGKAGDDGIARRGRGGLAARDLVTSRDAGGRGRERRGAVDAG